MTLGLATGTWDAIYLGIESGGIPQDAPPGYPDLDRALTSKMVELQARPLVVFLGSGGLLRWLNVVCGYQRSGSLSEAVSKIQCLLARRECWHEAYGLVCGFEGKQAMFSRVSSAKAQTTPPSVLSLDIVEPIGFDDLEAAKAAQEARNAIRGGMEPLLAVREAIECRLGLPNLMGPVETRTLRP